MRTVISGFNGAVPRLTLYGLPDNVAAFATNVKLVSGEVRGLHTLTLLKDFLDPTLNYAFRIPDPPNEDIWLKFQSPDAVVIRSPVTNDAHDRYYTHEPGQPVRYNTLARIKAGQPAFLLGVPQPTPEPTVVASGGSGDQVERTYVYTFVSAYGEEGPPSLPSDVVTGYINGTWNLSNLSATVPDAAERNIVSKNIYRSVVSAGGSADFMFVANIPLATTTYADTIPELEVASLGRQMISTFWGPPPPNLEGIVSFPGGIIIGWKDDTVFMSVPYRPWAWPEIYQISVEQPIVGIGVTANVAVVMTKGEPHAINMTTPDAAAPQKIQAAEPCLSRGSISGSPDGVFYASQNGLMLFGPGGFNNVSRQLITKEEWTRDFNPTSLRSCRYQTDYIGITKPGVGYVISAEQQPMTLIELTELSGASNIFNDIWTGEVLLMSSGRVWKWDDVLTPEVQWRWASKRFFMPYEVNIGAARIGTKQVYYKNLPPPPAGTQLKVTDLTGQSDLTGQGYTDDGPPAMLIPSIPNYAAFRLFVYVDGKVIHRQDVVGPGTLKLPAGIKSQDWQFGILGRIPMAKFEFAESARELAQV